MTTLLMPALSFKPRVPVFDAHVCVGDRHDEPSLCRSREALLAEMDAYGVQRALIYHAQSEVVSPIAGNVLLDEWLDKNGRLFPLHAIMPTPESMAQVQGLHAAGQVVAVCLHDTWSVGLPFQPWAYGGLLAWLSQARIPVWIPIPDMNTGDLVQTLSAYPDLVTVLFGAHYSHTLLIRPILSTLPNAHLELSRYEPIGEVEALRDDFGAQRLLYGSWYPRYAIGPILFYLHHTDLTETELALVCNGNLERILGIDRRN